MSKHISEPPAITILIVFRKVYCFIIDGDANPSRRRRPSSVRLSRRIPSSPSSSPFVPSSFCRCRRPSSARPSRRPSVVGVRPPSVCPRRPSIYRVTQKSMLQ